MIIPLYILGITIGYFILETNFEEIIGKLKKIMAVITCIVLLIAFPVVQITLSGIYQQGSAIILTTIMIYTVMQTIIGGYGVYKFVYDLVLGGAKNKYICCAAPFKFNITKFKSLVSGAYIFYMLLLWVPVQLIVSWVNYPYMSNVQRVIIYIPLLAFIIMGTIAYSMASAKNIDESPESERSKLIDDVDKEDCPKLIVNINNVDEKERN